MQRLNLRKYSPELMLTMFRKAASLRNEMMEAGFTDNGGAIHSAERILNILGLLLNYPDIRHINNLKKSPMAEFSVEARKLHQKGERVLIEHVSPLRDLTRRAIAMLGSGKGDNEIRRFVKRHFRLVLLSPEETRRLNRQNRSKISANRLISAGIRLQPRRIPIVNRPGKTI